MTTMLDAWFEECVRFLEQNDAWRDDAALIGQEKGRSLSALCSLRFHYTMWKRRTGNATEFATRYDEMMQMVEMYFQTLLQKKQAIVRQHESRGSVSGLEMGHCKETLESDIRFL